MKTNGQTFDYLETILNIYQKTKFLYHDIDASSKYKRADFINRNMLSLNRKRF